MDPFRAALRYRSPGVGVVVLHRGPAHLETPRRPPGQSDQRLQNSHTTARKSQTTDPKTVTPQRSENSQTTAQNSQTTAQNSRSRAQNSHTTEPRTVTPQSPEHHTTGPRTVTPQHQRQPGVLKEGLPPSCALLTWKRPTQSLELQRCWEETL